MTEKPEQLRWFVGVPTGTNLLVLKDLAIALAFLFPAAFVFMVAMQLLFTKTLGLAQVLVAASYAGYVIGFAAAVFFAVTFLVFGNRTVMLYRLSSDSVYCETMRGRLLSFGESMHILPFPVSPITDAPRSVTKILPWRDVYSIKTIESLRVIILGKSKGSFMRIWCPDETTFRRAIASIEGYTGLSSSGHKDEVV